MNFKEYIHNLQQRPVQERKKIAVVATAVGFAVILLIWIVSFNEMNKPVENQTDPASASLNDLKDNFQDNFQTGKDSIQDMMQELPAGEMGGTTEADNANSINAPSADNNAPSASPVPDANLQDTNNAPPASEVIPDQKPSGVPQLP